jgi:hypothetical protein
MVFYKLAFRNLRIIQTTHIVNHTKSPSLSPTIPSFSGICKAALFLAGEKIVRWQQKNFGLAKNLVIFGVFYKQNSHHNTTEIAK